MALAASTSAALHPPPHVSRRAAVLGGGACCLGAAQSCTARTPGSADVTEAIAQILDARIALRQLRADWSSYAVVNAEGRAGDAVDQARRILGGVAPQRGDAAIALAEATPLYRIDGAFNAVRKFALGDAAAWASSLEIEPFVECGDDIAFRIQKIDDSFYSVVYASKGSAQLEKIYGEARAEVDRALADFDAVLGLLREAGAPGV